jgi:hypothetical protein
MGRGIETTITPALDAPLSRGPPTSRMRLSSSSRGFSKSRVATFGAFSVAGPKRARRALSQAEPLSAAALFEGRALACTLVRGARLGAQGRVPSMLEAVDGSLRGDGCCMVYTAGVRPNGGGPRCPLTY